MGIITQLLKWDAPPSSSIRFPTQKMNHRYIYIYISIKVAGV